MHNVIFRESRVEYIFCYGFLFLPTDSNNSEKEPS